MACCVASPTPMTPRNSVIRGADVMITATSQRCGVRVPDGSQKQPDGWMHGFGMPVLSAVQKRRYAVSPLRLKQTVEQSKTSCGNKRQNRKTNEEATEQNRKHPNRELNDEPNGTDRDKKAWVRCREGGQWSQTGRKKPTESG
ncbi:hypothetical protein B0H17DRAFT_565600 [Mycena rosella]|uniref:Uncharacterized protein n=1 Tax=Mycena rosella TaxID=1033263 RepID=A0AAD7DGQ6_MYCRO|nr:hypothetical protein B0H17DRAFT_565600 [Mycena rosella]